ncbi:ABC transporter permease [Tundrisphaera lichenicola]|uniref:ABC transporter permease n=1 Tax=Tundrisphaera lichenicola TaxID=2029860 RepID=UPI003EBE7499
MALTDMDISTEKEADRSGHSTKERSPRQHEILIEARSGWQAVNLRELTEHRDLLYYMIWRNVKARYAQSALGLGWVIVQPLMTLMIFAVIFGRVVQIKAPGGSPYLLFAFCGLVPWTFFAGALTAASNSLVNEANTLTKVYFPRLFLPFTQVAGRLVDLAATLLILLVMMIAYGVLPRLESVFILPVLILIALMCALGFGLWLASLAVQYRDIAMIIGFLAQVWMYVSPVIYPASMVPDRYQMIYGLNPMVGVISGFRSCLLGHPAMPWIQILESFLVSVTVLVTGAFYFRRTERIFTDVV